MNIARMRLGRGRRPPVHRPDSVGELGKAFDSGVATQPRVSALSSVLAFLRNDDEQTPNIGLQRTSACGLAAEAGSFAALSRLIPKVIAVAVCVLSTLVVQAGEVPSSIVLSWNYEATEMPDAPEFNATGTRSIPLKVDASCKTFPENLRLHSFQYIEGKTNAPKALRELAAGVVIYVSRQSDQDLPRLCVTVESGRGDTCCGHDSFSIPRLSQSQWAAMPHETAWVFQKEGMAVPELWNIVFLRCE